MDRGLARSGAHALVLALLLGGSGEAQAGTPDAPAPSLSLSLDRRLPQNGGFVLAPAPGELPVRAPPDGRAWKVWLSGYLRAPLRCRGARRPRPTPTAATPARRCARRRWCPTPPPTGVTPAASYRPGPSSISMSGPRVQATVQIASENITDAGYRQLAANLGINHRTLTIWLPGGEERRGRGGGGGGEEGGVGGRQGGREEEGRSTAVKRGEGAFEGGRPREEGRATLPGGGSPTSTTPHSRSGSHRRASCCAPPS